MPSLLSLLILVSSDQITLFQSSNVQFSCSKAHYNRALLCTFDSFGFFTLFIALRPCSLKVRLTVVGETLYSLSRLIVLVASSAVFVLPLATKRARARLSLDVNLLGRPRMGSDL